MPKYLKLLIIGVFVLLVAAQANKSFVLDELDFPIVSHAASETLKPIYYRGETSPMHVGTYHPTLYINSLAAFIRVFGFNETTVRFFGVLCALLSVYLLLLILRQLIKKNEIAEILLLGFYLLNPYTIANTTLPDIDSTVLPVVLLLFIYVALKFLLQKNDMRERVVTILASFFALALWSKLTTPLIIPVFLLCLTVIISKDYIKSFLFTIKVTLLGASIFFVTYFFYCELLGLSTTYTYTFLVASFTKGTSTGGPLVGAINNLGNFRYFVYWLTLPIIGLLGVTFLGVITEKATTKEDQIKRLLIIMSILVTFFYIALISPFGGFFKYPFPVFGILILGIVFFYDRHFRDGKINWLYGCLAFAFGFLIERRFWKDSMFLSQRPFAYLLFLLLIIIASYLCLKLVSRKIAASFFMIAMLISIGFQLSISRVQAIAPYSTKYLYGQIGLADSTSYLRANTAKDEPIWSMKDVGYYVHNRYYESYEYYFDKSLTRDLIRKLRGGKVRYYVVTTGIGQDNIDYYTNIKSVLNAYAVKDRQFGNFVIYKSKE